MVLTVTVRVWVSEREDSKESDVELPLSQVHDWTRRMRSVTTDPNERRNHTRQPGGGRRELGKERGFSGRKEVGTEVYLHRHAKWGLDTGTDVYIRVCMYVPWGPWDRQVSNGL